MYGIVNMSNDMIRSWYGQWSDWSYWEVKVRKTLVFVVKTVMIRDKMVKLAKISLWLVSHWSIPTQLYRDTAYKLREVPTNFTTHSRPTVCVVSASLSRKISSSRSAAKVKCLMLVGKQAVFPQKTSRWRDGAAWPSQFLAKPRETNGWQQPRPHCACIG